MVDDMMIDGDLKVEEWRSDGGTGSFRGEEEEEEESDDVVMEVMSF